MPPVRSHVAPDTRDPGPIENMVAIHPSSWTLMRVVVRFTMDSSSGGHKPQQYHLCSLLVEQDIFLYLEETK